jgi:hypothetical protein
MMQNLPSGVSADHVGVLEGTEEAGCYNSKGFSQTLSGVSYTVKSVVNPSMDMSKSVCAIKGLLGEGSIDAVEAVYTLQGLQCLANQNNGNDVTQMYVSYFESATWIDDMIHAAMHGEKGWTSVEAQKEGIEKGVMDQVLTHGVVQRLTDSISFMAAGNVNLALHAWDSAYALYVGHNDGCAPYARAVKRASNYATYATTGEPDALANEQVLLAMVGGQAAILAGKSPVDHANEVMNSMAVTYFQASLRYLHKMDTDLAKDLAYDEHRGEGKAFWNVVAPIVADQSKAGAAMIEGFYNLFETPTAPTNNYMFCEGRDILVSNLPGDVPASTMGELEGTSDIDCAARTETGTVAETPTAAGATPTAAAAAPTAAPSTVDSAAPAMKFGVLGLFAVLAMQL